MEIKIQSIPPATLTPEQQRKLTNFREQVIDICSSGSSGAIAESEWKMEELKELSSKLPEELRPAALAEVLVTMAGDTGWAFTDMKSLGECLGLKKTTIVISCETK